VTVARPFLRGSGIINKTRAHGPRQVLIGEESRCYTNDSGGTLQDRTVYV
jgi:hypothetical protein